jgi:hypothetical protein
MPMFDDDTRKMATVILSKRKPNGVDRDMTPMVPEQSKNEDGTIDGRHLAAQDMIAAIHSKSAQQLSEAVENWMSIHNSKSDNEGAGQPD